MKIRSVEYYFIGLLVLVFVGFWPSYFSKFFDGSGSLSHYFHFHAATATLWIVMLIAQPILIRKKQFLLHKRVGKFSYLLVPILFVSILLLAHHRANPASPSLPMDLWITFKDLIIFSFGYGIAIRFRKSLPIHMRGMIVAGMALIEPTLYRLFMNVFGVPDPPGYFFVILPIYLILIILMIRERNEPKGRWVFPTCFILFATIHSILIFKIEIGVWKAFAHWFVSLGLT